MSKVGEGRASDLIKRFERLALDSNSSGPPIRIPKRSSALPATTTTVEGAQWSKLPSGSQSPHTSTAAATAYAKDDQESAAAAPSHMPNTASSTTSSVQDLMTISSYSYAHASPASASAPGQPERMQSLLPGRARANTTESVVRLSQIEALKQRKPSNSFGSRQKTLVTALNQRANIDPAIQASSRSWLNSAERRIDEAMLDLDSGDLENAYLRFMIACNIISEKIPKQKDFDSVRKEPKYIKLHKDVATRILDELEKLASELRKQPYVEPKRSVMTPEQVDKMESNFAQMYPENPLSSPLTAGFSAAASEAQPSMLHQMKHSGVENGIATSSPATSTSDSRWLAARQSKFDEIDAQARRIDANVHSSRAHNPMLPGVSIVNRGQPRNRNAMAISPPTDEAEGYDSRAGKASIDYFDPNATTCTPKELWGLLEQSRTGVSGRPMVLILDIRPHQDFVWGRIDHRHIVNIDPIGLDKQKCTARDISASLMLVSEEQQMWFRQRDEFDIIVYASQSARSFSDAASTEIPALEAVNRAIYHYEFDNPLKRSPLFLIGGFDAWARAMGSNKCIWSDDARKSLAQLSGVRAAKSPKIQPTPQPDIPSSMTGVPSGAPNAVSNALASLNGSQNRPHYSSPASGGPSAGVNVQPAAVGSVFDFFQQNNGYHPQWQQQGDGRHAPMHTSYTQGYNARMTPRMSVPEPGTAQLGSSSAQHSVAKAPVINVATPFEAPASTAGHASSGVSVAHSAHAGMNPPALPPKPASLVSEVTAQVQRRKTIFDNPNYGFTGPAHVASDGYVPHESSEHPDVVPGQNEAADGPRKRRKPPKVPLPTVPQTVENPIEYAPHLQQQQQQQQQQQIQEQAHLPRISKTGMPPNPPPAPPQNAYIPPKPPAYILQQQQQQQQQFAQQQQQQQQQHHTSNGHGFYNHPVAAGSDPSLNGRMHAGNNLRSSILYQTDILPPDEPIPATPMGSNNMPSTPASANFSDSTSAQLRRRSQLSDTAAYGATGLKNFGNTCFMNCVIQCLVGTAPFARYFMQGGWKKDMVRDNSRKTEVTVEFARLVDNMWRGQYGSISPIGFRSSVGKCSEVFKGNDQEDAHEFATFLLDTLHESLNRVHPRPKPEREFTPEEEMQFETLPDVQQADIQWGRYIRRNWSITTSIFQGQSQSRLTCLTCNHTSTTYYTFTELSVPIPSADAAKGPGSKTLVRKSSKNNIRNTGPVNIYQCLDAYSETEILEGDNKWMCPRCKTKRRASKRLLISRLPLVLIVHLKRFSTIGHFREKLETNVLVPTRNLYMDKYAIQQQRQQASSSTCYNLYGVANHFGTLSGGHYTASVFNGLRGQWNYFDDTRVSIIPENNVATPAAYLLFFVQAQQ